MAEPRLIVALDYPDADSALAFVRRVQPSACRLKVGLELFTAAGPGFVGGLVDRGFDVFLDLKYHDIPNTVARACAAAARLGVWMLNVHALGGERMLRAAVEAVGQVPTRPLLVAVTVLTSHAEVEFAALGLAGGIARHVAALAALSKDCGLDGVVCSAQEASRLRAALGPGFVVVTPGIRPAGAAPDDQSRVVTPRQAVENGADYLVVGRPVTRAADPVGVLDALARDLRRD